MNKMHMALALGTILSTIDITAHAATLNPGDVLTITPGVQTYVNNNFTDVTGSWFAYDLSGDIRIQRVEKLPFVPGPDGGLIIGVAQDTNGHASHPGRPHPGMGGIDAEFDLGGASGMHFTTLPVTGSTTTGGSGGLDFTGWTITWNTQTNPLGGGAWQPLNCNVLGCGSHTFTNGNALFSWDGVYGNPYTLYYSGRIPNGTFAGVGYVLHLEGVVNPVPIPAGVWLLASGLVGLAGFMRPKAGRVQAAAT